MQIYRLHAPPLFWSDKFKLFDHCSGPISLELDFSTESMAPSPFSVRIHLPTSFNPIKLEGPGKTIVTLPEECFWVRVSLKSHSVGQVVLCKVS